MHLGLYIYHFNLDSLSSLLSSTPRFQGYRSARFHTMLFLQHSSASYQWWIDNGLLSQDNSAHQLNNILEVSLMDSTLVGNHWFMFLAHSITMGKYWSSMEQSEHLHSNRLQCNMSLGRQEGHHQGRWSLLVQEGYQLGYIDFHRNTQTLHSTNCSRQLLYPRVFEVVHHDWEWDTLRDHYRDNNQHSPCKKIRTERNQLSISLCIQYCI